MRTAFLGAFNFFHFIKRNKNQKITETHNKTRQILKTQIAMKHIFHTFIWSAYLPKKTLMAVLNLFSSQGKYE